MRLEDVCTVFTDGDWIESKDQSEKGIRLVQTGNIGEGIYLEKESRAKYIPEDTFKRLKCTEIFPGDILVSRLPEPVGRACIIPEKTERMITAVDCTICRPDEALISKDYLCYFMRSNAYYMRLLGNVTGTTRKRISRKNLGNVELKVPTKEEQKTVVERLDCLVKVIDSRTKELQLLDDLIKARFIEMFGDPIINSKHLETKELKDVLMLKAGDFTAASEISDDMSEINQYPCYGGNGVRGYVSKYNQDGEYSIIGRQGALSGNVQFASGKFKNTEHALLVTPIVEMNNIWLNQLLINLDLKRYQTGAAQPGLSVKNLQEIEIIYVPIDKQNQFASFVEQTNKSKFQKYNATILSHNIYVFETRRRFICKPTLII